LTKTFRFRHYQKEGKDFIELADDLAAVNQAYAEMLLKRYKIDPRASFRTGSDPREMRQWVIGQRMFQSFLNQYRVPYIHDEPAFKFTEERLVSDFMIPSFGSVDVKTRPWKTDTLILRRDTWDVYEKRGEVPNNVLGLRLDDEEKIAEVMGYGYGVEVSGWPNNSNICIYAPCHSKLYRELHPFSEIFAELKALGVKETFE